MAAEYSETSWTIGREEGSGRESSHRGTEDRVVLNALLTRGLFFDKII